MSESNKWKELKNETKQSNNNSPDVFLENGKPLRSPKAIANALNRGFIKQISDTVKNIDPSDIDPLKRYAEKVKTTVKKFFF